MNVNIGGTKKWTTVPPRVRERWKVLDIAGKPAFKYNLNSGEPLPFVDNSIDNFYTSHTLEHIQLPVVSFIIKEIYRTLKPNGLIRVVVPNVQLVMIAYLRKNKKWLYKNGNFPRHLAGTYPQTLLGYLMTWFYSTAKNNRRSGHNMVFDWDTLVWYFQQAGFRNIVRKEFMDCSSVFIGLDFKRYRRISLYMEAQK